MCVDNDDNGSGKEENKFSNALPCPGCCRAATESPRTAAMCSTIVSRLDDRCSSVTLAASLLNKLRSLPAFWGFDGGL